MHSKASAPLHLSLTALALLLLGSPAALAQDSDAELAQKLSNPVASLISVPFQYNHDCCFGADDGARETLNIQPVIPFALTEDWSLIVRTIVPVIRQDRTSAETGSASGLGDVTQSFFFSPKSKNGLTWAFGPALLWPAGEAELGTKQWGAGPTGLVLMQNKGWTYGVLANHIWTYADLGDNGRARVSQTFLQPFLSWTSPTATTISLNTESTYNWKSKEWSIPINMTVSHLYKFGGQRVSLGAGAKLYPAREGEGPEWGLRLIATLLYPR